MTYIELQFPFTGTTLPSDHGYGLYGAISRIIPEAHSADWLAIETIPGLARGDGVTQLDQQAKLKIRMPYDRVPLTLKLAGKRLEVDGHAIRLGAPQIHLLKPSTTLYARIVTIKGFTDKEPFLDAVHRQLDELGVKGELIPGERRVVRVGNHTIVGFSLTIHKLSDQGSLIMQERGIGGRRRMGCGFFNSISRKEEK
jgi:CRISPR-associated protein Cas6